MKKKVLLLMIKDSIQMMVKVWMKINKKSFALYSFWEMKFGPILDEKKSLGLRRLPYSSSHLSTYNVFSWLILKLILSKS